MDGSGDRPRVRTPRGPGTPGSWQVSWAPARHPPPQSCSRTPPARGLSPSETHLSEGCSPARLCPSLPAWHVNFVDGLLEEVGGVASGRGREEGAQPLRGPGYLLSLSY